MFWSDDSRLYGFELSVNKSPPQSDVWEKRMVFILIYSKPGIISVGPWDH